MVRYAMLLALAAGLVGCTDPRIPGQDDRSSHRPTYLALGDSYTIGEGVEQKATWPSQLTNLLRANEIDVRDPVIVAETGWTTDELAEAIDSGGPGDNYDLVTLLIGVNNQYRGRSSVEYREEFRNLLQTAISMARGNPANVVVVSIPDWGVTPFAEGRDRAAIEKAIDEFNVINQQEAERAGAGWVDVTRFSRDAGAHRSMITDDGLHPSGMQYGEWARLILPAARKAIGED